MQNADDAILGRQIALGDLEHILGRHRHQPVSIAVKPGHLAQDKGLRQPKCLFSDAFRAIGEGGFSLLSRFVQFGLADAIGLEAGKFGKQSLFRLLGVRPSRNVTRMLYK